MKIAQLSPVKLSAAFKLSMVGRDGKSHTYCVPAGAVIMKLPKRKTLVEDNPNPSMRVYRDAVTYAWVENIRMAVDNINGCEVCLFRMGMNHPVRKYMDIRFGWAKTLAEYVKNNCKNTDKVHAVVTSMDAQMNFRGCSLVSGAYAQFKNTPHAVMVSSSGNIQLGPREYDSRLEKTTITRKGTVTRVVKTNLSEGIAPSGRDGGRFITDGSRIGSRWYAEGGYRVLKMGLK